MIKSIMTSSDSYKLAENTFSDEEINAAKAVLDSSCLTMGEQVKAFETEFAAWTGATHALMVNSGSSANLLIVDALLRRTEEKAPLKPGDEVIVPALSWPTTVWPLIQLGLVPVFVDVDLKTMSIDISSLKSVLSPKTKAVFVVHVLGQIGDITTLQNFCEEKNLILIEDACESLGSRHNGTHAGRFGIMGSFSCYFSHHISTIEGGVIITDNESLYNDLKSARSHGWTRGRSDEAVWNKKYPSIDPRFMFISSGYNVRPTEINAAIGRVQLKKLDKMISKRIELANFIEKLVHQYTPWLKLVGSGSMFNTWMTLPFMIDPKSHKKLELVKNHFENNGIETRPIIAGNITRHPAFQSQNIREASILTNSDYIFENGFMIGCHPLNWRKYIKHFENAFAYLTQAVSN